MEDLGDDGKGRYECKPDRPYDPKLGKHWYHPHAKCIIDGDYTDTYKCYVCGITFDVELPE